MGYPVPLTTEDWARIRYEYESTHRKIVDICAEHGISEGTLRDRVRRWGWTSRWSGPVPREGPPPMVVSIVGVQAPEETPDDPVDLDELRANLNRQLDALMEQERQERPRRYLAAWEEFAAEAAQAAPQRRKPCAPHGEEPPKAASRTMRPPARASSFETRAIARRRRA